MKTKSTNKLVSVALALFMLLMSIPFSMLATTVKAEEAGTNTHVLNAADLPNVQDKEKMLSQEFCKDGIVTAGNGYFKIHVDNNTRFDTAKEAKFEDDLTGTQRLNFNGGIKDNFTNSVEFTTSAPATVKVWWKVNKIDRQITIRDGAGKDVASTSGEQVADSTYISELKLAAAGKYYLGSTPNAQYIYKIEVKEIPATKDYTLVADDLETIASTDKDVSAGTDKYFTIKNGNKGRVVDKEQKFDDGYVGKKDIDFNGATDSTYLGKGQRVIEFTAADKGQVKLWWVSGGDARNIQLWKVADDGTTTEVVSTAKNNKGAYIDTLKFDGAGKYYLGAPNGTCLFYKVVVTEGEIAEVVKAPWDDVAVPAISSAAQTEGKSEVKVTVKAVVGANGGDKLSVTMYDKDGKEVETKNSLAEKDSHELTFSPKASGKYTFKAVLTRDGEENKVSAEKTADFVLPLGTPTIASATSKGKGSDGKGTVEVVWNPVDEATGYEVYCGENKVGTTNADATSYKVTGLEIGKEYSFTIKAVRNTEVGGASDAVSVKTTEVAQQTWGFMFYGTSTSKDKNTYSGDLNADGKVTVSATGNGGKFQEGSNDGLGFYYTSVPSNLNFTLRAKVHVNTWTYNSGQDGFGVMALDCLPGTFGGTPNSTDVFWTNSYRVGAQRFAYWYDTEKGVNSDSVGDKYQMNIGVGIQTKLGMTKDNIANVYGKGATGIVEFGQYPLETSALDKNLGAGTYHSVGNMTNPEQNPASDDLKDFILEIQRNNTGYFLTYYAADGKTIIGQKKFYDPKALDQLDPDNVYVGFCAARNMVAEFSDVTLTTIDPKDDKPAEERPITKVEPTVSVGSSSIANSPEYTLLVKSNVVGTADIIIGGKTVETVNIDGTDEYAKAVVTIAAGTNKIEIKFTPDKDQELPPYTQLSTTDPVTKTVNVKYETYFEKQNNLYVSPKGTKGGNGGKEYPLDIYTAVSVVRPGQTIVLMEGTYNLETSVSIERGINGTKDKMIKMIADPDAKTRPVFNFGEKATVKTAGLLAVGDYWYFQGFDVTKTPSGIPGILVSGNNCTFDDINAYTNGDCGIYIRSKGNSADPKSLWPSNNLILNCTSYNNADGTGENADGFAAKFSVGKGNVFDGCVAYNNTDDGWDLYARGVSIETVTIRNCVAYENGHNTDKSKKGNGNGFKLGGENMPAGHTIINSIAFNNDANGITSNSCPDIKVKNCISFNNKAANISLYTGNSKLDTNFEVDGVISFRSDGEAAPAAGADVSTSGAAGTSDNIKPQGTQKLEDLQGVNNFYFDGSATKNSETKEIKAEMFSSLEFSGKVERAENGMIDLKGFLALKEDELEKAFGKEFTAELTKRFVSLDGNYKTENNNAGTSQKFTITADDELPPPTGFGVTIVVAVIAISAAVAIILIKKRKRN